MLTPSKYKEGQWWTENRRLDVVTVCLKCVTFELALSRFMFACCVHMRSVDSQSVIVTTRWACSCSPSYVYCECLYQ